MAVLFEDNFNRANVAPSASALGSNWSVAAGAVGIQSNAAYVTTTSPQAIAVAAGTAVLKRDVDITTINTGAAGPAFVIFRYRDVNNFWYWGGNSLQRRVAGTYYQIWVTNSNIPNAATFRVAALGDVIKVWTNGVLRGTFTDEHSVAGDTGYGVTFANSTTRLDNFLAQDPNPADFAAVPGKVPILGLASSQRNPRPGWLYKGRDTKAADTGSNP